MIKEKLEKCADSSGPASIKEEPGSCESSSKDSGTSEIITPKKEEESSPNGSSNSNNTKEPNRVGRSSTGSVGNVPCNNNSAGGTGLVCDSGDVSNMLDTQGESVTVTTKEDPSLGESAELSTDGFNDLNMPGATTLPTTARQPAMMPHVRPSPNGVQPLASNVIGKQSGGMEVQYMQQQSQIFVFSTLLANKSADAVLQGHFQSIIAYHCAQPGTKKYLEKHPLKLTQFQRQSPAQWLNGLAMMKNKGCVRGGVPGVPNFPLKGPVPVMDGFPNTDSIVDEMQALPDTGDAPWDQRNNHHVSLEDVAFGGGRPGGTDSGLEDDCLARGSPDSTALMLGHSPCITSTGPTSPSLANLQPSLQGVKVPDEDLTPQQRQHREEQLATIRKMQQMLFPEHAPIGMGSGDEQEMTVPPGGMQPCQGGGPGPVEWQKLQNQFFESKMKQHGIEQIPPSGPGHGVRPAGPPAPATTLPPQFPCTAPNGTRLQGPPPPYHQTPRSASVPIALQSPNPASPNNPTSNLSLPSPRTSSALNSPAESSGRQFTSLNRHFSATQSPTSQNSPSAAVRGQSTVSNPGTPISSHFSPGAANTTDPLTTSGGSDFNVNPPGSIAPTVDGMFCRTLQSIAQKQQLSNAGGPDATGSPSSGNHNKEPNLMPVPSPQQIQYLNTFEGQELTIQKQPNTSLKERNMISPSSIEGNFSNDINNSGSNGGNRISAPTTPATPSSADVGNRFPLNNSNSSADCYRLPAPSPTSTTNDMKNANNRTVCQTSQAGGKTPSSTTSPMDMHGRYPMGNVGGSPGSFPNPKPGGMMNMSPSGKNTTIERADNVPLNPNSNNGLAGNNKGSHFDPISSLAQMSQLLTSTISSSLNSQPGGPSPGMMPYGGVNAPPMDMGGCVPDLDGSMMGMPIPHPYNPGGVGSPKNVPFMGPQRMMRPNMPVNYNGANVQVKASAPNTIQYLPARPQMGPANPRGPPSLDFLQRFANPNMEPKMGPGQNMQYFPGCGPGMNNNMGPMDGGGHMHNDGLMASIMNGSMMGKMPPGMVPQGMMGMRNPGPRPVRMQGGFDMGDGMYPAPGQMFGPGPGPKGPMARGLCAPDATQPLPPSVGQAGAYKSSPFAGGPTTADPNYAQQFHNFQQQLYATSTRSQLNNQAIGPGPGPPTPQPNNSMYFMSK